MEPGVHGRRSEWHRIAMVLQGALLLVAALLAAMPPPEGVFLLVPLVQRTDGRMVRVATDAGAQLVGQGELSGSLYVRGSRSTLLPRAAMAGALLMEGTYVGCFDTKADQS